MDLLPTPHRRLEDRPALELILLHMALMSGGLLLGWVAALIAQDHYPDLSNELRRARELGIVSLTILTGYPKSRDLLTYALTFALPFITAFGLWLMMLGRYRREMEQRLFRAEEPTHPPGSTRLWLVVLLLWLFGGVAGFNINQFTTPGYNPGVGSWISLGEEGENLAWVQSLRQGGEFGKDFFCLYGPMLIQPLAWLMDLFGPSMLVQRIATYALDLMAMGAALWMLSGSIVHRSWWIPLGLGWVLLFSPMVHLAINTTYLRVVLAMIPLYLLYRHALQPHGRLRPWLAGLILGQSLLFSQEAGICALLAGIAMLTAGRFSPQPRPVLTPLFGLLAGTALSMTPMLGYLHVQDALAPFLDNLMGYPRLVTLGYGALPYPSLKRFVADPWQEGYLPWFGFILFYGYAATRLAVRLTGRGATAGLTLRGGLLLFGLLLYRSALGRSDEYHLTFTLPPALWLWALLADDAWNMARGATQRWLRPWGWTWGLVLGLSLAGLVWKTPSWNGALTLAWNQLMSPLARFTPVTMGETVSLDRAGGVVFHPDTALDIARIHAFLEGNTRPGEAVYFFPNEALYYFLFDRANPTRYAIAYFAVTTDQRLELVADLERSRPRYVVYSLKTWRVDNIPERMQVPEVTAYLQEHYRPVVHGKSVAILQRQGE